MDRTITIFLYCVLSLAAVAAEEVPDQVLTFDGLVPVRIGMTVAQAENALNANFKPMDPNYDERCGITNRADGVDPQISYMIQYDKIVRIDIDDHELAKFGTADPHVVTEKGIRIGATEDDIKEKYGATLTVYDGNEGEHYLNVLTSDQHYGLTFEALDGVVINFRAGIPDAISLVEGCS